LEFTSLFVQQLYIVIDTSIGHQSILIEESPLFFPTRFDLCGNILFSHLLVKK
jgi:hypothetical protein